MIEGVRALHPPQRDETHDVPVYCGGLCYEAGDDYDDYGRPIDWPCPTAALVYSPEEIAAQGRYTLEARAYMEDIARTHRKEQEVQQAARARQADALAAAHRLDSDRIREAYEAGSLSALSPLEVDPEMVKAFLHAMSYRR